MRTDREEAWNRIHELLPPRRRAERPVLAPARRAGEGGAEELGQPRFVLRCG